MGDGFNWEYEDLNKHSKSVYFIMFFVLFGITIRNIQFQYLFMVVGFIYFGIKNGKYIFPYRTYKLLAFLSCLVAYALFNSIINFSYDYFEAFRFLRCMVSTMFLGIVVVQYNITPHYALAVIKRLLLIHAIAIIACILVPGLNELLVPISNHTKSFYAIRSSGLMSGEDAAGYLCNIGLILVLFDRISEEKKPLSIESIIFIAASVFTSRFTMVMIALTICITFLYLMEKGRIRQAKSLLIIIIPMVFLAAILVIISTPFAYELRVKVLKSVPVANKLFEMMTGSYTDYSKHTSAVYSNITISDLSFLNVVFGIGTKSNVSQDSGYIKTIYSIGLIGILAIVSFHIKILRRAKLISRQLTEYKKIFQILSWIVFVSILWELKYSFLFSSTFYETFVFLFLCLESCYEKYGNDELNIIIGNNFVQ